MRRLKKGIIASVLFLCACGGSGSGGGGGGGGGGSSPLAGTWSGTFEDSGTVMHTASVTIDANGNITQITDNGVVQTGAGATGTTASIGSGLYSFTLSDGTVGGFFVDATSTHMAFLDEDTNIGVLQKGAGALPTYASTDIAGSYAGFGVDLDSAFNLIQTFSATASATAGGSFTGSSTVGGAFSGSFSSFNSTYGRYRGSFTQGGVTGSVAAFLSTDKTFAALYACPPTGASFIGDCTFFGWHK